MVDEGRGKTAAGRIDPEVIEGIVEGLSARLPLIVQDLMATYRERIPSYAAAPDEFLEEVERGTTASFNVGLGILREETDTSTLQEPLIEMGRRRAAQGIPLGDALLAWQISTHTFWWNIVDLAPDDPAVRAEVMRVGSSVIFSLLENAVPAVSAGYLQVDQARVADEEHDIQTIVETLAALRDQDHVYKGALARRQVDPSTLDRCLVCASPDDVGGAIRALRERSPHAVVGRIGSFIVAFGNADGPPIEAPSPAGLADNGEGQGYTHALSALRVAEQMHEDLVRYEEVVPLALIIDAPLRDRAAFVRSQLGPLLDDNLSPELVETLRAFYSSGQSIAAAARSLHVHRHTMEYRLDRIATLLDVDLKEPSRRLLLELALTLADDVA